MRLQPTLNQVKLLCAALALTTVTGCASVSRETGSLRTLTGILVLKGSAPMVQPTLVLGADEHWELLGVSPETAAAHQNQRVTVRGTVVRARSDGFLLPALKVTRMELDN